MYSGSCLCKKVTFQVNEKITEIECCHCMTCRKAHASAFSVGVSLASNNFVILSGAEYLNEFESSLGKFRVFCKRCGSHLYAYRPSSPSSIRLRPACLDMDLANLIIKHIHCETRII